MTKFVEKSFSVPMPSDNAKQWPPCDEVRLSKGEKVGCIHPDGMGHKGGCVFPVTP